MSGGQLPFDLRHDVHHVAVTLDDHQVLHLHAAEIAHAPDVVAREVHEHDVFGAFLRVGEQFLFQRGVFLRRLAAAARAGDGANLNLVVLAAHVNFRRRADERKAVQFEQEHVGRRIDRARGAVNVQRRRLRLDAEKRCEPTTWMMSPAVMYFLALRTLARNFSFGTFDSNGSGGTSSGTVTG